MMSAWMPTQTCWHGREEWYPLLEAARRPEHQLAQMPQRALHARVSASISMFELGLMVFQVEERTRGAGSGVHLIFRRHILYPVSWSLFHAVLLSSSSEDVVRTQRQDSTRTSLTRNGIPCSGPETLPVFLSRSAFSAIERASGFTSMMALSHRR